MAHSTPQERARLLDAVRTIVGERLPPDAANALLARLDAHAQAASEWLLTGVNPGRLDADPAWDEARAHAYAPTVASGAVHLELVAGDRLAEFLRLDFDREYGPDLVADVTALPLREASVDRVASNSLVEHVSDPHAVLRESFRVLRPGGVMVVVMPFVWKLHGYPHDYVRLTPQFFERVCREIGFTDVVVDRDGSSGLYNVLHNTSKMAGVDPADPEADALRAVQETVIALLGTLIPLDRGFTDASREWFHSVRVLARKPGAYEPSGRDPDRSQPLVQRVADLLADPATKAPLRAEHNRLVCEFTGQWYPVENGMAVFTEPRAIPRPSPPLRARVRDAGRRLRAS